MTIEDQRNEILVRMQKAILEAERKKEDVSLIAVSKVQPDERIEEMLACGQRIFGENRVQEAATRWHEARRNAYPDLQLHLIGPLQTNKVKDAVALFDVFETLDRVKLAEKLADEMARQSVDKDCFIQVNTGEEDQKSGILPNDLEEFYEFCVGDCGLSIKGLMCIPPLDEPAGLHFGLLQTWATRLGLVGLSMGMSDDFEQAIGFGATQIRVGSSLFGERLAPV